MYNEAPAVLNGLQTHRLTLLSAHCRRRLRYPPAVLTTHRPPNLCSVTYTQPCARLRLVLPQRSLHSGPDVLCSVLAAQEIGKAA